MEPSETRSASAPEVRLLAGWAAVKNQESSSAVAIAAVPEVPAKRERNSTP